MSQHWNPPNTTPAYTSRPARTHERQRGSEGLSMMGTWIVLTIAMLLFLGAFLYLVLLETGPICRDHPFRPHETVCADEPTTR